MGLLGLFENKLITFSENPTLHYVPDDSLYCQVQNVSKMPWGMNTNFEKVMDLIIGLSHRSEEQRIEKIFVFSDMQFDQAFRNADKTHFETLKKRFEEAQLKMPQIIFWNLKGNTDDFPVKSDERGVILLSGYSPSMLNNILNNQEMTPLSFLLTILNSPRYDRIQEPLLKLYYKKAICRNH